MLAAVLVVKKFAEREWLDTVYSSIQDKVSYPGTILHGQVLYGCGTNHDGNFELGMVLLCR